MASGDRIFVSPGVFTSEKDLTFVTRQVGVTTLGLLGETPKGPAFEPVFISNYDEFTSYFGSLNTEKFKETGYHKYELNYIAKSFLTQTNQLYVSRVLGLSGYKAGNAWCITMDSAPDPPTISPGTTTTYTGLTTGLVTGCTLTSVPTDTCWTGGSGLTTGFTFSSATFFTGTGLLAYSASTGGTPVTLTWDDVHLEAVFNAGSSAAPDISTSSFFTNIGKKSVGDSITQSTTAWIKGGGCNFTGVTFDMEITHADSGATAGFVTGATSGTVTSFTAACITEIDGSIVTCLRSRGEYGADQLNVWNVPNISDAVMTNTADLLTNPYASFNITGSSEGKSFNFGVSLDKTKKNYIPGLLGTSSQDKETGLWVEEIYSNALEDLVDAGKVFGLNGTFFTIASGSTNNLDDYLEQWKSAKSPWVLSEVRGNKLRRLFRFITISDGDAANEDVKFSIINIKPDNKTFDLLVRKFYDTDSNISTVEKFSRITMDPTETGFIARKIGTADGEYPLRSKYIMVELADGILQESVIGVPAGFEGVLNRDYIDADTGGQALPPQIEYKTEYGALNTSKLRKTYLGISSSIGIDQDFFDYKGINQAAGSGGEWSGKTDGFHMDVNAEGAQIITGPSATDKYTPELQVGVSAFTTDASLEGGPYEKLVARKFTFAPYGGYDGWDVYRLQRTNTDSYLKTGTDGKAGLLSGVFSNFITTEDDQGITSDYYAFLNGIYTYNNPEAININVFATPGLDLRDQPGLIENAIDVVEVDRADSLYIITTPDTDSDGVTALDPDEAVAILDGTGIDSNYSATYWPWLQMNDTENNQYLWLPPTLEVVRNIALTDNVAFPWFAAAGLNRGTTNAIKARVKLTLDQRDTLYEGRINPMATFSDVGVVIWGNKTLQEKDTALNRINVRRLLLQARKLISAVSIRLLFEQNDEVVRNQFLSLVNPILDNIRKERGLTDFRVVLDDTPESIDRNELNGKIFIKPTRSLEYISIEFNITNTGASFDDI